MSSGRPDWFGTIVSAGKYDTEMIPIGVDKWGHIIAVMQGVHNSDLETIALDENHIMKANLSVQDLDFLTVRPAYGETEFKTIVKNCPTGQTTSLLTISGRGVILGGQFAYDGADTRLDISPTIKVEGNTLRQLSAAQCYVFELFAPGIDPLYLINYNIDQNAYEVGIAPKLTFETSFEAAVYSTLGSSLNVALGIFYAKVP